VALELRSGAAYCRWYVPACFVIQAPGIRVPYEVLFAAAFPTVAGVIGPEADERLSKGTELILRIELPSRCRQAVIEIDAAVV
jgi:hypothetical protein